MKPGQTQNFVKQMLASTKKPDQTRNFDNKCRASNIHHRIGKTVALNVFGSIKTLSCEKS